VTDVLFNVQSVPFTLLLIVVWAIVVALFDRRNARRERVQAVSIVETIGVLVAAIAGSLFAPRDEGLAVGLAIAGIGIAAYGDIRHRFMWEEISVSTCFAVLAARALSGTAGAALYGMLLMAALALLAYFVGQYFGKEMGFGDVLPVATVGAALGFVLAPMAMFLACVLFVLVAVALRKRLDAALPFGPAIAGAVLIGSLLR